jgi:hypothetical protein
LIDYCYTNLNDSVLLILEFVISIVKKCKSTNDMNAIRGDGNIKR